MKSLLCVFSVIILSVACLAQPQAPDSLWTKTYGGIHYDFGHCVECTNDGGFVVVGETMSFGNGFLDIYLIKTDCWGGQEWYRTYGGSQFEYGYYVQQTTDNGFILVGSTDSFGSGREDVYLIKTDSLGNQEWSRTLGGNYSDIGYCAKQTIDNGFIIVGSTESYGSGGADIYLIKTDELGVQQWYRTFGEIDNDWSFSVLQTLDGGFVLAGGTNSLGAYENDMFLIKTDILGNELWFHTYGYVDDETGHCVQQTIDGGYCIVGWSNSYVGSDNDVFLVKTDSLGNQEWFKVYGGNYVDYGYSLQNTVDNGYIIAGWTYSFGLLGSDIYLIKTDPQGNLLWYNTYGGYGYDYGRCVRQISNGGYIITGHTNSFCEQYNDVYLIRLDAEGSLVEGFRDNDPSDFVLYPSHPNPFNSSVTISFDLKAIAGAGISIYDIAGKEVSKLETRDLKLGINQVVWDASAHASGIYFVRLQAGDFMQTQKVVLLK